MITISIGGLIAPISSIICTVISGVILKIITKRKNKEEENHKKRVEAGVAEMELILSIAGATGILLRKANDERLNGELEAAEKDLTTKKRALQKITRVEFFDNMEE